MSTIETGGPAFPMQEPQAIHAYAVAAVDGITDPDERDRAYLKARAEAVGGASMRDYFAAKAMQGLVSGHFAKYGHEDYWPRPEIASEAYEIADAMLAARKPEYEPTRLPSQALDDSATIAGLQSAVSHLSALFDEFRALLVEVNDVCGRDGHGGQLEDGESEIIDKVRAALSMTEASAMFPPDGVIAVGFGYAALHKDGKPVWSELNDVTDDELMTGADAEALAAQDPDHDWRIVLHGPLSGRTYQRHEPGKWMLVEKSEGFA